MHFSWETGHYRAVASCLLSRSAFSSFSLVNYFAPIFVPLLYCSAFDYFTISFFLIYLNACYIIRIFELFSCASYLYSFFHHVAVACLFISSCTLLCHMPADTSYRFSQTYNFNNQHIKRQCSYPVFPCYFSFPWRFNFTAHCNIFLFPFTSVTTDSIMYTISILSCKSIAISSQMMDVK